MKYEPEVCDQNEQKSFDFGLLMTHDIFIHSVKNVQWVLFFSEVLLSYFLLPFKLSLWNLKYEWTDYRKDTPYIPQNNNSIMGWF